MKEQQLKLINTEHLTSQYSAIGSSTPYKHEGKVITPERSNRPILKKQKNNTLSEPFQYLRTALYEKETISIFLL
jgi:hypothetical protein